jgi:hypothetical protein
LLQLLIQELVALPSIDIRVSIRKRVSQKLREIALESILPGAIQVVCRIVDSCAVSCRCLII